MSLNLKTELKDFQVKTVKWMKVHENNNDGGLLMNEAGLGKCHKIDTPILMFDGTIKKVQDINVGESLMGDNSTSRKVLSLARGVDIMYEIISSNDESYIVNQEHILCLKVSEKSRIQSTIYRKYDKCKKRSLQVIWFENLKWNKKTFNLNERKQAEEFLKNVNHEQDLEIAVKDYIKLNNTIQNKLKGYKVSVEFPEKYLNVDPYIIGLCLGDETLIKQEKFQEFQELKEYNLIHNKHIPMIYKCNSRGNRLKLLAGLLDSNGSIVDDKCIFNFSKESEKLIDDIIYLARSIGFACYKSKQKKMCWSNGYHKEDDYYIISISGNIYEIPSLYPREKSNIKRQIKNVLVTDITVKEVGYDNYYGFEIDNNRRYVMGDFTVTHNTICTLSVICDNPLKTLIICPAGIIDNWINEIKKHTNISRLKVVKYYGANRQNIELNDSQLIYITSYSIVSREFNGKYFNNNSLLSKICFGRIVLDEAHYIRNVCSNISKSIMALSESYSVSIKKWIVTATPIFNETNDAFAYFKFLGYEGIDSRKEWTNSISKSLNGLQILNDWFKKYGLALKKSDVLRELKTKNEISIKLDFSTIEQEFYDSLKEYSQVRMKTLVSRINKLNMRVFKDINGSMRKILHSNVMVYILRLKQACNSPWLILRCMERLKGTTNMRDAIERLRFFNESKNSEEECPICYDTIANYIAEPCGHKCCEKCWNRMINVGIVNCPKCRVYVENIHPVNTDITTTKNIDNIINIEELKISSKIKKLINITKSVIDKNEKIVIVSQWVSMLEIIRHVFENNKHLKNVKFVSLQGNIPIKNRTDAIERFQNDKDIKICFVSLMSSAEGISLVASNHLVLMDSWWNNAKTTQVMDRIHRIGQVKDVTIYNLQIKNSIEEQIAQLVNKKRKITNLVLDTWSITNPTNYDESWITHIIKLIDHPIDNED